MVWMLEARYGDGFSASLTEGVSLSRGGRHGVSRREVSAHEGI